MKRIFYWDEAKDGFEVMRIGGGQCMKEIVYHTRSDIKRSYAKANGNSPWWVSNLTRVARVAHI